MKLDFSFEHSTRLAFPDIYIYILSLMCLVHIALGLCFFLVYSRPNPVAKQKEKSMFEKHNTSMRGKKRHNIGKRREFLKFFEFHTRLSGFKRPLLISANISLSPHFDACFRCLILSII